MDDTEALAKERYEDYKTYSSFEGLISTMSGIMGIDLAKYPLDEPIAYEKNDANQSALEMFTRNNQWTLREVIDQKALCGTNVAMLGTPGADRRGDDQPGSRTADLDGFNIARIVAHETTENFIAKVIPELQTRGRYKTQYAEGRRTFREKMFGHGSASPRTTRLGGVSRR